MEINDTGIRGYLKWLKQDQPGLYALAAPKIAALLPQAFSDFEQSKALGYLCGDNTGAAVGDTYYYGDVEDTFNPGVSSGITPEVATVANVGTASPATTNTISNIISALVQGYQAKNQIDLAKSQVDTLLKVNDMQLQRAQIGIGPLDISTVGLKIPQVGAPQVNTAGVSPGSLGGIGGLLLAGGLVWALIKHGRGRAA